MTDSTGFDQETQLATLASEMITTVMNGEPAVVANWVLVVDVRNQDQVSHIGVLTPSNMPDWIRDAMLREVGVELDGGWFEGDEDE